MAIIWIFGIVNKDPTIFLGFMYFELIPCKKLLYSAKLKEDTTSNHQSSLAFFDIKLIPIQISISLYFLYALYFILCRFLNV